MEAVIDPQLVVDMVQKRAWLPLGALAVGACVRLLKYDIKFFPSIPSRYRVWAAFALGQVAGSLEAVIAGKTYKEAILWGLTQSVIAIIGQNTIIDSFRDGKEIPVPGLTIPPSPVLLPVDSPKTEVPVVSPTEPSDKN
jgi:hypothetical protein